MIDRDLGSDPAGHAIETADPGRQRRESAAEAGQGREDPLDLVAQIEQRPVVSRGERMQVNGETALRPHATQRPRIHRDAFQGRQQLRPPAMRSANSRATFASPSFIGRTAKRRMRPSFAAQACSLYPLAKPRVA